MATTEQILAVIEELHHAYPGQKLKQENVQVYINHLLDIHPHLLWKCVDNLIATSTWFPRISEIRAEAGRIVGHNWISTWEPPPNPLRVRFRELEDEFFHHRKLDPDSWIALAEEFERRDCPHSAVGARSRLEIFQQILEEESKVGVGKAYLPHKQYP
jgi:hypothetical protein